MKNSFTISFIIIGILIVSMNTYGQAKKVIVTKKIPDEVIYMKKDQVLLSDQQKKRIINEYVNF
ncbi:MAG: hypothetical protein ABI761_20070, partial [Saprospiraceae bacterium]